MMLQVLPKSHGDLAAVNDRIGNIHKQTTNWQEALKYFQLAHEIQKKKRPSNHPNIDVCLNSLGNYHKAMEEHSQALDYY